MSEDLQLLFRPRGGRWHMMRVVAVALVVLLCCSAGGLLHGQISEADKKKRDAFLKAREEMRTVPSSTPKKATATGKPKPARKKSKSGKKAKATPTPDPEDDEEPEKTTKKKKGRSAAGRKKASTPAPTATPRATVDTTVRPPLPVATPPPVSRPDATAFPDAITIEKSGLEETQGFEPPPPPPPRRGFFARLFGGGGRRSYRYLDRSVIEQIRRAPVQRSRWKFIIVHNSGTRQGNARAFDYYHRRVRRMQNGMAYHFVVGNGTSSRDGGIEIGDRWRRQINGGHVHSDYLNNISLGICLVGDFNRDRPTRAQLEATEELIKYLRERCGRADGRVMAVRPHKEMNPPRRATDCPGDAFPYAWFRRF